MNSGRSLLGSARPMASNNLEQPGDPACLLCCIFALVNETSASKLEQSRQQKASICHPRANIVCRLALGLERLR